MKALIVGLLLAMVSTPAIVSGQAITLDAATGKTTTTAESPARLAAIKTNDLILAAAASGAVAARTNLNAQDAQTIQIMETVRLLNMLNGKTNTPEQVKAAYSAATKTVYVDKAAQ